MRKLSLLLGIVLYCAQLFAQQRTLSGKVSDANGNPIANASVTLKGSSAGTSTAADGTYNLRLPDNAKFIVFSAVGWQTVEYAIGNKATINPSLAAVERGLQEVVVTGYGSQKKATLTSAQIKVGGDKLENVPFASVDQTLQGKVAGLQSITSTGQPGAAQSVRIRGIGSISASAQPLYVVDGIQINAGDITRNTTTANTLAGINPDDIERVDVLKDAAATAIYGSRGGNGVILITTKKGRAGKSKITVSSEIGQNTFVKSPDNSRPIRATDWLNLAKEGMTNAGIAAATVTSTLHTYGDTSNIDSDWFGLLTRKGTQQQYNVSASGGDEKTNFYLSGGYFNQQSSVFIGDIKRYNGTISVQHHVSKNLLVDLGISGSYYNQNTPLGGSAFSNPIMDIYFLRPTQNPYNTDGTLNISRTGVLNFGSGVTHNPLYTLSHNIYNSKTTQVKPNLFMEYNIMKGLKASTRFGVDYNNVEEFQYWNPNNGDGVAYNGYGFAYYTRYFLYDWTNQLNYHAAFLKDNDLSIDVKAGYESIYNSFYGMTATANTYSTDKLPSLANASVFVSATNTGSDYRFASAFSNAVVSFRNKYAISGSYRRDGSSRFGPNNKYGNFYSVGGSWNLSEESFIKGSSFLSLLKVRASYGLSGNAEIGNYTATALQNSGYNYNGAAGTAYETVGNETLGWEKSKQFDIGLDASILKDRVSFIIDWYNKNNDGLLYAAPISQTTGFSSKTANIGGLRNRGIEFTVNATPIQTKDFRWDISANITHNVNRVTSLPNNNADIVSGLFRLKVGQDYRSFYTYNYAGVNPSNGDPLWYSDTVKSSTTNDYTKAVKAYNGQSASPKYYGGLSNTISYKGFGLTVDLTYNFGNYVYDAWGTYFTDGQYALTYGKYQSNLRRWTTPGQITDVPKYVYNSTNKSNSASTRFLYKGDYIRLRNLEVFYNAPRAFLNRLNISSLRFYVRGTNLWTKIYDQNLPFDPEQGVNGSSNLTLFMTRSATVGLTLGL